MRQYTADFETIAQQPFDDLWERKLTSVQQVKGIVLNYVNFLTFLLFSLKSITNNLISPV